MLLTGLHSGRSHASLEPAEAYPAPSSSSSLSPSNCSVHYIIFCLKVFFIKGSIRLHTHCVTHTHPIGGPAREMADQVSSQLCSPLLSILHCALPSPVACSLVLHALDLIAPPSFYYDLWCLSEAPPLVSPQSTTQPATTLLHSNSTRSPTRSSPRSLTVSLVKGAACLTRSAMYVCALHPTPQRMNMHSPNEQHGGSQCHCSRTAARAVHFTQRACLERQR